MLGGGVNPPWKSFFSLYTRLFLFIHNNLIIMKVRELAAVVASKVFYHLGSYEVSLDYALGAGNLFDVTSSSQYVETIIAKCIDIYTSKRLAFLEVSL